MAATYWIKKQIITTLCSFVFALLFFPPNIVMVNYVQLLYFSLFISHSHVSHIRDDEEMQLYYPACTRGLLVLVFRFNYVTPSYLSCLIWGLRQRIWFRPLDYNDTNPTCGKNFSITASSDMIYFIAMVPFTSHTDEATSLQNWKGQLKVAASLLHEVQQQILSPDIWGDKQPREKGSF